MTGNKSSDLAPSGNAPQPDAYYPIRETARLLGGVPERYTRYLVEAGILRSVKIGRRVLIPGSVILDYLKELRKNAQQAQTAAATRGAP